MRRAKSTRKYFDFRSEKGPGPLQSQHRTATAPKSFFGFAFPRVSKERQRQSFKRVLFLAMANLGPHPPLLAANFTSSFT